MTGPWVAHDSDEHGTDPHIVNVETGDIEDLETTEQAVGRAAERNEENN